eukprot:1108655_1
MMMIIATQTTAKQMFRVNAAKEMNELIQYIKQCQPEPEPVAAKIDGVDTQEDVLHIEPSKPGTNTKMVMNTHELTQPITITNKESNTRRMKKNDTKMDAIDDGNGSQSSTITCTAYGTNAGEDTVIVKGGKAMVFCNNDCGWLRQMYCVMDCLVFVYVLLYSLYKHIKPRTL